MKTTRLALLALALPLLLGACRNESDASKADETAAASEPAPTPQPAPAPTPAPRAAAPVAPPAPPPVCENCGTVSNVVGAAVGAVAGGLLGNQIGGGSGKKIATVAGAVGGGLAGHEIEKRRNTSTYWEVTVQMDNGTTRTVQYPQAPGVTVGQKVKVIDGRLVPM
jgi:predicted lipid-binding transport protein (Tim44 family)